MPLGDGETPKLARITEAGSGSAQDREKALLYEIIVKVNGLFEGELSDQDELMQVNNAIKGKLLKSEKTSAVGSKQHQKAICQLPKFKN